MSSRYRDDDTSNQAHERPIIEAKYEAFRARDQLRSEMPSPSVSTKRQAAQALANYRDQLVDYRNEGVLETPWDKREVNVDIVDDLLEQTVEVGENTDWSGRQQAQSVPAVAQLNARHLIDIGKELDAIAKELGKAANVESEGELYGVKKDPDDYAEPKADGITKPQ